MTIMNYYLQKKNLKQTPKTKFIFDNVDLRQIPLENESIDFIVLSEVIEHIEEEEKALKEIYRVLKPNGKIVFSMPNSFSFYWQYQRLLFKYARPNNLNGYSDWEAKRHFSFSFLAIRNIIKSENFKIIKTTGCTILPLFPLLYGNLYKKFPSLLSFYSKIDEKLSRYFPFLCASYFLILSKKPVKN
jgi:ubiquinone/menaquinone biosynthesis C-methylase UbiE